MRLLVVGLSRYSSPSGICRYADLLCHAVSSIDGWEVSLAVGPWQQDYFRKVFNTHSHSKLINTAARNDSISRNVWYSTKLPELIRTERPDVVHFAYPVPFLKRFDCPAVVTVHDLYAFEVPENFRFPLANRTFFKACLRNCDAAICISRTTLNRLTHFIPEAAKSCILAQIYNPIPRPKLAAEQPPIRNLEKGKFFLTVGQHRPNKNLDLLQRVFANMRNSGLVSADWELVIVGSEESQTLELHQLTGQLGLADKVTYLSSIGESELAWLYSNCALAVFPSSHEGLCMPLVEALSSGARVVCSDIPTLREIGREACSYFDLRPDPLRSCVNAILAALSRSTPVEDSGDRFSTNHAAQQFTELYQLVMSSPGTN
jgi:glycosyltransferase involved in cell wall biosynthesis